MPCRLCPSRRSGEMAPNGGSGTRSQDDEYFDGILIATVNAVTSPEKLKDLISSVEVPAEVHPHPTSWAQFLFLPAVPRSQTTA